MYPLPRDVAQIMSAQIEMFKAKCLADAELFHTYPQFFTCGELEESTIQDSLSSAPKRPIGDYSGEINDIIREVGENFKGSPNEKLLTDAFNHLQLLLETRSLERPKPGQIGYLAKEHTQALGKIRDTIAQEVRKETLPHDCMDSFAAAYAIASAPQPRREWVEIAENRRAAGISARG